MNKIYNSLICIFISLFFLISGCSNQSNSPDYPPGFIKGKVLDSATHNPLAGVSITTVPGASACMSDTGGNYFLSGIQMGSSGTNIIVIAARIKYLSDTIPYFLLSDDTATINFSLRPNNGVYIADNINIEQYTGPNSYSSLDLSLLTSKQASNPYRDLDLKDSSGLAINFRLVSSHLDPALLSFITKVGGSLGSYTKTQFDALDKINGFGDSIPDSYFSNYNTDYFSVPLVENSVYPVYLYGRYILYPNQIKTVGLLYIKNTYIDNGIFKMIIDLKVNRNGINYFIPNN